MMKIISKCFSFNKKTKCFEKIFWKSIIFNRPSVRPDRKLFFIFKAHCENRRTDRQTDISTKNQEEISQPRYNTWDEICIYGFFFGCKINLSFSSICPSVPKILKYFYIFETSEMNRRTDRRTLTHRLSKKFQNQFSTQVLSP